MSVMPTVKLEAVLDEIGTHHLDVEKAVTYLRLEAERRNCIAMLNRLELDDYEYAYYDSQLCKVMDRLEAL